MNQTPPVTSTPEIKPEPVVIKNPGKVKKIIITVIISVIIILSGILIWQYLQTKQQEQIVQNGKITQDLMIGLRTDATKFYNANFSYKNWQPDSAVLGQAMSIGSTITIRKPDYQNYIMYAFIPADGKYFCIDTHQFIDEVNQITDKQTACKASN